MFENLFIEFCINVYKEKKNREWEGGAYKNDNNSILLESSTSHGHIEMNHLIYHHGIYTIAFLNMTVSYI